MNTLNNYSYTLLTNYVYYRPKYFQSPDICRRCTQYRAKQKQPDISMVELYIRNAKFLRVSWLPSECSLPHHIFIDLRGMPYATDRVKQHQIITMQYNASGYSIIKLCKMSFFISKFTHWLIFRIVTCCVRLLHQVIVFYETGFWYCRIGQWF